MYTRFKKEMEKRDLLHPDKKIVLAVSGGVDSIVLFHLLQRIPENERPSVAVAHVNHQLRAESDEEEMFVKNLADSFGLPVHVHHWPKKAQPENGIEEAARNMRYSFFKQVMEDTHSDILMTAHHQDDQVETILMKMTRGSSLEQITGIEPVQPFHQGLLIRPLLPFSKEDIYRFAFENQLEYMEDQTNQELEYSRNRFRNQIIPLLKEENDQFNEHIERFASDLNDLLAIAQPLIEENFKALMTVEPDKIEFQLKPFYNYSEPMQRALLLAVLEELYQGTTTYKISYVDILENWLKNTTGNSQLHLTDDIVVQKTYQRIRFAKQSTDFTAIKSEQKKDSFTLDEQQTLIHLSPTETIELQRTTETDNDLHERLPNDSADFLYFHPEKIQFPLTIRHRRPGDRMSYKGLKGTKKIKDIFIDEKVPLEIRDKAWVVEDANGIIIWLIAYRKMDLLSDKETDKLTYVLKYNNYNNSEEYYTNEYESNDG